MALDNATQTTKTCDFCGETILAVAKKCKHCESMLDGSPTPSGGEKKPFALKRLMIGGVVVFAIGLIVMSVLNNQSKHSREAHFRGVKASLSSASALNVAAVALDNNKGVSITNCTDASKLIDQLPSGYTISSKPISEREQVACTLTNSAGDSDTFVVMGVRAKKASSSCDSQMYLTADLLLSRRGKADQTQQVGSDGNGLVVEWKYSDCIFTLTQNNGSYRVMGARPR